MALLVGSTALAPLAAADEGLVVLVFVGPEGVGQDDTIEVNVEAYHNGVAADLDTINVSLGILSGVFLDFTNVSAGKYHATYTITADDVTATYLSLFGSAQLGLASANIFEFYSVGGGGSSGAWEIKTRLTNHPEGGLDVGPGASVIVEARSYNGGALADGGPINMSMITSESGFGGAPPSAGTAVAVTKIQDGVYQTTVVIPAVINNTRIHMVTATLGSGDEAPTDSTVFFANPYPIMTVVESSTATSAALKVYVGGGAPISGAVVSLTGMSITSTPPYFMQVGPFTGTTDASGTTRLTATWSAMAAPATWNLNVTSGGKMVMAIVSFGEGGPSDWTPSPPDGFGCEVNLQTDPEGMGAGQTVTLTFRVTEDGVAVAEASVTRFVFPDAALGTSQAGNVTTDESGDLTVTFEIREDWESSDMLNVQVVCPSGETGTAYVFFDGISGPFGTGALKVSATGALGGAVQVTATYSGSNAFTGATGYAAIIPGNVTNIAGVGLSGGGIVAPMTRSGSTWTASLSVPAWLGTGDYTVICIVTNDAATATTSDQTMEGNMTTIHLTPAGSTGGTGTNNTTGGGGGGGGFLPGFDAAAGVGAVAAGAALVALARRRRD